jgi:hypothetical protein
MLHLDFSLPWNNLAWVGPGASTTFQQHSYSRGPLYGLAIITCFLVWNVSIWGVSQNTQWLIHLMMHKLLKYYFRKYNFNYLTILTTCLSSIAIEHGIFFLLTYILFLFILSYNASWLQPCLPPLLSVSTLPNLPSSPKPLLYFPSEKHRHPWNISQTQQIRLGTNSYQGWLRQCNRRKRVPRARKSQEHLPPKSYC